MPSKANVLEFIIYIIREFSREMKMTVPNAYKYLIKYQGIKFLEKHYGYEHTLGTDEIIENVIQVCKNNGGDLG